MHLCNGTCAALTPEQQAAPGVFETMLFEDGHCALWPYHYQRLQEGLAYYGAKSPLPEPLLQWLQDVVPTGRQRVRLEGRVIKNTLFLSWSATPWQAQLASIALIQEPIVLRWSQQAFGHKHLERAHYDKHPYILGQDALVLSPVGQLIEASRGNLLLKIQGRWVTPKLGSWGVHGVLRRKLRRAEHLHEQDLTLEDIQRASAMAYCNALQGVIPVDKVQWGNASSCVVFTPEQCAKEDAWIKRLAQSARSHAFL